MKEEEEEEADEEEEEDAARFQRNRCVLLQTTSVSHGSDAHPRFECITWA